MMGALIYVTKVKVIGASVCLLVRPVSGQSCWLDSLHWSCGNINLQLSTHVHYELNFYSLMPNYDSTKSSRWEWPGHGFPCLNTYVLMSFALVMRVWKEWTTRSMNYRQCYKSIKSCHLSKLIVLSRSFVSICKISKKN